MRKCITELSNTLAQDVAKEQKVVSAAIRGTRHDAIESESKKTSTTVYPNDGVRYAYRQTSETIKSMHIRIFIFSIVLILFLS